MAVYQIYANVDAQNIAIDLGDVKLVSGSNDIYQVSFTFSDEWDSFTKKVVFYTEWKKSIIEILLSGTNIVTIPTRSLANPGILMIGVYGTGTNNEKFPTVWSQKIHIYEGTCQGYENPPAPDPDVYDEILAAMAGKQDLLTFDEVPTEDSDNPVKSGGVYSALETKADTNGIYPELVAGSSEQLLSQNYTVDKAPYLFRPSPFKSNRVRESIVGGSVGWNQLVQNGDFSNGTDGWGKNNGSFSVSNKVLTFVPNSGNTAVNFGMANPNTYDITANRVYLAVFTVSVSKLFTGISYRYNVGNGVEYLNGLTAGQKQTVFHIYKPSTSVSAQRSYFYPWGTGANTFDGTETATLENHHIHDLTAMFPPAIVDYVWTLEQATAGSGIAWLKSYGFFKDPCNAFDAGSIQSVCIDKKKVVGFNQFDKSQAVVGERFNTTGTGVVANTIARSAYIPCLPNTDYYISNVLPNQSSYSAVFWFDENKQYIRADGASGTAGQGLNMLKTSPANAMYVGLNFYVADLNGICLNISDPARNGQYEPYQSTTYDLDHDSLNGLLKLDANNNLYYDGDVRKAIGQTDRKYTLVNMGSYAWGYNSTSGYFYYTFSNKASGNFNLLCEKYATTSSTSATDMADKEIKGNASNGSVYVKDSAYTDAASFKAAVNGVYLLFPLGTPVSETSTPFPTIESLYTGGTEEFTDYAVAQGTRDMAIPVGHESEYLEDSQAKLDGLPWNFASLIAPTEATYTATRNYSTGALLIVNNVLYKATANIANGGTITPNTNVTATTLAEVISAL